MTAGGTDNLRSETELLSLACEALAAMVADETPPGYTLAEAADIWGDASTEQVAALEWWEATQVQKRASAASTSPSR